YLLRLLAAAKAPDGSRWADEARRLHPDSYELALLGVPLYHGEAAVARLQHLLDEFAPTFTAEERPAATAAFSRAVEPAVGPFAVAAVLLRHESPLLPRAGV